MIIPMSIVSTKCCKKGDFIIEYEPIRQWNGKEKNAYIFPLPDGFVGGHVEVQTEQDAHVVIALLRIADRVELWRAILEDYLSYLI